VTTKHPFAAALIAFTAATATIMPAACSTAVAADQPADLQAQAMAALKSFTTAVDTGSPAALGPVLAPEFQIERADGSGMDREAYLKSDLPKFAAMPEFTGIKVSGTGDLMVVRYYITLNSTRNGKVVQRHAPRLTVFRKQGDSWLVVAHANFATLAK
jgi:uncharacterized protein DUF4440